jgi:O-antigen/teichoic acid export membrane protein
VVGLVAYEPGIALLIFLVAVNQAVASCRDVFFGAMQRHERMDVLGIGQMISGVLNLAFLGGAIFLTRSLHIAILAAIITKVLMLVLYDRPYASWLLRAAAGGDPAAASLRPSFSAREMWPLVKQAAPLGLMMMMSNAGTNVPRYFVEAAHGEAMLGYFAAVAALLQVGTLAVGALGQSASPRLAKYFQDNLGAFKRLLAKSCAVGAAVGVVGLMVALLASRPILELLFTPEYGEYGDILVVVMIAGGILYVSTFFGFALTAARYLKVQVPISVVILLVVLVSSWLLIGPYGLMGAALTLVAGAAARLVTQGGVVAYAIKKRQHQLRQT